MDQVFRGGCLCGQVRYAARGAPLNMRVCHCRACQRAIGAAFNARLLMPLAALRVEGPLAEYASSPDVLRGFCPNCGTTLFSRRTSAGVVGLTCGSLDHPAQFRPTAHIWTDSRQPWLQLEDGLPQHPKGVPTV